MFDTSRKGLFGKKTDYSTPPYIPHDNVSKMPAQEAAEAPQARKPGLFGQGGPMRGIAGTVGDFLLQYNNMAPIYAPAMQQQQAAAAQQAADARKRSLDLADYRARKGIDQEYARPEQTALMQNYEYLNGIDPALAQSFLKRQTDPIQWITGPDGIPRPFSTGAAPPTAPVGKLTPIGGGPQAQPAGTFRPGQ